MLRKYHFFLIHSLIPLKPILHAISLFEAFCNYIVVSDEKCIKKFELTTQNLVLKHF